MSDLRITIGTQGFEARFEHDSAPKTCAAFAAILPFSSKIVHVRWSGFAMWIPLGDLDLGVGYEDALSHPAPGQILFHPGGVSEPEILIAYGPSRFVSKSGQLAGNHFITITKGLENLAAVGNATLWEGAHDIRFEAI